MLFIWLEASSESILDRLQVRCDPDIHKSLEYNASLDAKQFADRFIENADGQLARTITSIASLLIEYVRDSIPTQ
jgi:hypothetical protein